MNQKIVSIILATALLISLAAAFEMTNTVKALATPTITITASTTYFFASTPITLTATISGATSPVTSSITWQTSGTTGTFSTATTTSTTSTVTYTDTSAGTVTITAKYPADSNNNPASNTLTIYNLDFNHDGFVNFNDVIYFAQAYIAYNSPSKTYNAAVDLNHDGVIDFNDITLFVGLYESYTGPV